MRRLMPLMGITGLTAVAVLLMGGVVVVQVVLLTVLAFVVIAGAVALSVEQSFRLLERAAGEKEAPAGQAGAVMPR